MKNDVQLKQDVEEELAWDPAVDHTGIGVQVRGGVVTLTGHLPSFAAKYCAEAAVRRVSGVKALAVELDVHLPGDAQRSDGDIAWAAENALSCHAGIPVDQIRVMVEHGVVTLTGEVDWEFQRKAAAQIVAPLYGVRSVINGIVLRPRLTAPNIAERIEAALQRQALDDASHVKVTVEADGTVALTGRLRSLAERQAAFDAAWNAPGVKRVIDQIDVGP